MQNINELIEALQENNTFSYLFFWGHRQKKEDIIDKSCFSQWFPKGLTLDDVYYPTAEHYMMVQKARLFEPERMEMIRHAKTTKEVKLLGRSIRNFDEKIWEEKSFDIVLQANIAKFSQDEALKDFLLSTGDTVIVEASLYDKVWGIGMLGDDNDASYPLKWKGKNKLGFVLMRVREILLEKTLIHKTLIPTASQNIKDILSDVFVHDESHHALVIYDLDSPLSCILAEAYRIALPNARFINFNESQREEILFEIDALKAHDFVALIQSTSFRLSAFRIRIELFKKSIKVAEHPHLARMPKDEEMHYYIHALAYDKSYFHHTGHRLKALVNEAKGAVVYSGDEVLIYSGEFEDAKINIGDYREMKNIGGQFPIGEVFTEAKVLTSLNGSCTIIAFGDRNYKVNIPPHPITIIIKEGKIIETKNTTEEFEAVLKMIREEEDIVWVRELGLGLNRAFSKDKFVSDMGTFERMCGLHLSLGAKHGIYAKEGMKRNSGKFHIDVMIDTSSFEIDGKVLFDGEKWLV
jgi:ribA/ribD-fused uncharacterized protein